MKTWQIARGCLIRGKAKPERVMCTREYQNSIDDSVMAVLEDQAEVLGLKSFYQFQKKAIYGANGTTFGFKGLARNINSLKSFEGATLVWNEEATDTTAESLRKLYPTIVRTKGAQILNSFNPENKDDPIYVRHVLNHDPATSYLSKVGYLDNPWIDEAFIEEAEFMKRTDFDAYMHVYGGECWSRSESQVLNGKWVVEAFEADSCFDGPYFGADWGFSNDPSTLVKLWIGPHRHYGPNCLYVEYETGGVGVDIDELPHLFGQVFGSKRYTIRADCARPETRSYMNKNGFKCVAAKKWTGGEEDGVAYLRSFDKIIIHRRCEQTAIEAKLYSYKIDPRTQEILPDIVDKFNHYIDAIRYALQPIITHRLAGITKEQVEKIKKRKKATTAPTGNEQLW